MRLFELALTCCRLFCCCFRLFQIVLGCFACLKLFKFVLVRAVAGLGCAWPSWLFYVAFGVIGKLGCFRLFQIVLVVQYVFFFLILQLFRLIEYMSRSFYFFCCLFVGVKLF